MQIHFQIYKHRLTIEYLANFIISKHIHTSLHRWDVKIIPVSIIKFIGSKEISRYYNFCLTRTKDRCEPLNFLLVGRICKKKVVFGRCKKLVSFYNVARLVYNTFSRSTFLSSFLKCKKLSKTSLDK